MFQTRLAGEVALLDQVVQETRIRGSVTKVAAATHPQRLVDGTFELAVLLFNVAVLVCSAQHVLGAVAVDRHDAVDPGALLDLNGAEAADWHAHVATQPERRRGQRAQRLTFLEPTPRLLVVASRP